MRNPSVTYRFLCAVTAITMLFGAGIPSGMSAFAMFAHCDMMMTHDDSGVSHKSDLCEKPENHVGKHHEVSAGSHEGETADCGLNFHCSCTLARTKANTKAVPVLSKTIAGFTPVTVQILTFSEDPEDAILPEQVFSSLYSPPIFLKNSSFLN